MLLPGNTGQPPMLGPPLAVGTTVAVDVAVGLALGTPATVEVLVAGTVAEGVVVRVAVPVAVDAGELVEVRVGVVVATGTGVRVLVAVAVADAVAVRVGTCVDVGVGRLVGVRVGVAVARGVRGFAAASERDALNEMKRTTSAVSENLKRRFITISLPGCDGIFSRMDFHETKGMPRDTRGGRARSRSTGRAAASLEGRSSRYCDLKGGQAPADVATRRDAVPQHRACARATISRVRGGLGSGEFLRILAREPGQTKTTDNRRQTVFSVGKRLSLCLSSVVCPLSGLRVYCIMPITLA